MSDRQAPREGNDSPADLLRAGSARFGKSFYCWGCGKPIVPGEEQIKQWKPRPEYDPKWAFVEGAEGLGLFHERCRP